MTLRQSGPGPIGVSSIFKAGAGSIADGKPGALLGGSRVPQFPLFKAAVAAQKAGTKNARIIAIGDSTTAGWGSPTQLSDVGSFAHSYPFKLAGLLSGGTTDSRLGSQHPGNARSPSDMHNYDPRIALGSGWVLSDTAGPSPSVVGILGDAFLNAPSASNVTTALSFAPTDQTDTLDIYYARVGTGGTFKVDIGGASLGTTNTSGANGYLKATYTAALGANTWNITPTVNGDFYIHALVAKKSSVKTIEVVNAGWSGGYINNLSDTTSPWGPKLSLPVLAPDLTIICETINDINVGTVQATFQSQTQTLITAAKLTGDVLLMSGVQSDPARWGSLATNAQFRAIYDTLAASNGIYHLDLVKQLGTYATLNGLGLMASDGVHPTEALYAQIAALVKTTLASAL